MKKKCKVAAVVCIIALFCTFNVWGKTVNEFVPRKTPPNFDEPYYKPPINNFPYSNGNCTWYAFGRAYEILGQKPVFNSNAYKWWDFKDSYSGYGDINSPRVGSIAVWGPTVHNGAGHVAVVEKINADGSVDFSESHYGRVHWEYNTHSKNYIQRYPDGYGGFMEFYGYIYLLDDYPIGWYNAGGFYKYGNGDGTNKVGWYRDNDTKNYYFDTNGNMMVGWNYIDGKRYHFSRDGFQDVGWTKDENNDWYYCYESGGVATGWFDNNGKRYYMDENGKMYSSICMTIDGVNYNIDKDGIVSKENSETTNILPSLTDPYNPSDLDIGYNPSKPSEKDNQNVASGDIENNKRYKYRTRKMKYEYTTSTDSDLDGWECIDTNQKQKWGEWSEWSADYIESSSNIDVQTRKVSTGEKTQIYLGRYYSKKNNDFSPNKLDSSYSFEGGWFDEDEVSFVGQAYNEGRDDCYEISGYHYYFFEIGSHGGERRDVSTDKVMEYRYREKVTDVSYKYRRKVYTNWSEWKWSDTPVEESDVVEVMHSDTNLL